LLSRVDAAIGWVERCKTPYTPSAARRRLLGLLAGRMATSLNPTDPPPTLSNPQIWANMGQPIRGGCSISWEDAEAN